MSNFNASTIYSMTYPDFIGLIDQENTPPGARYTINEWIDESAVNSDSFILDLACSTGYSSQQLSTLTGCSGVGIDLSEIAIQRAQNRVADPRFKGKLRYQVADATKLPFGDGVFSHVAAGSCFGFIANRERALEECARVCCEGGKLLTASWYYQELPSEVILSGVERVLGYRPSPERDRDYWIHFFSSHFDQCSELVLELPEYDDSEIEILVNSLLENSEPYNAMNAEAREAVFDRLFRTRKILRDHSRFQGLFVSTWRRA